MNTTRITLLAVAVYGIISLGVLLSADHAPVSEVRPPIIDMTDGLPEISASAWGVIDLSTGDILYSVHATSVLPVASVTKLVTAAVVNEVSTPTTTATVYWTDLATEGRAGGLYQGQQLTHQELLFPLLLESSNDAATVLSRTVGEVELLGAMTRFTEQAGMRDTAFFDGSGLSSLNVSTVEDLGRLLTFLYERHPHILDITSLRQYLSVAAGWHNNSPFINDVGYVGGKHGYLNAAGRTAVVIFEEQFSRGETLRIGYVVLGSDDLLGDVRTLRELIRTRGLGK